MREEVQRIFLSYSREDKSRVQNLYRTLKERDLNPWMDVEDLGHIAPWEEELRNIIWNSALFLACISEYSFSRRGYFRRELIEALKVFSEKPRGKFCFIPLLFERVKLPSRKIGATGLRITDFNRIDFLGPSDVDRAMLSISKTLNSTRSASATQVRGSGTQLRVGTERLFRDVEASWCPELVEIPPGNFAVASMMEFEKEERLFQEVSIASRWAIGRFPVTFDEFDCFARVSGCEAPDDEGWGRACRPVINVSWHDAQRYCRWLSKKTSFTYRLPSEALWEYACRAGTSTPFHFGSISPVNAVYSGISQYGQGRVRAYNSTATVGTCPPNRWGLYDMHGNVREWCEDVWCSIPGRAFFCGEAQTDGDSTKRSIRGGSWYDTSDELRADFRDWYFADRQTNGYGFRVARLMEEPA